MTLVTRGCGLLAFALLSSSLLHAQSSAPAKPAPFPIPPEAFAHRPGDALSLRTLVQRPPAIPNLIAWTIETRRHRGSLTAFALSPDGKRLATGGIDGNLRIWNTDTAVLERILVGHSYGVAAIAWSPDGNTLASTGGSDGTARLWDANTGMTLRILRGHKSYPHLLAWAPDGQSLVVAGGASGFVTLWDLTKVEQVRTIEVGNVISAVAWSPNNRDVAISGRASGVQVRELRANTSSFQGMVPDMNGTAVAWSPDGKLIAGGSPTKTLVWEAESGNVVQELDTPSVGIAFSPDGAKLAVSSGLDVKMWLTAKLAEKPKLLASVTARAVVWAPDSESYFSMAAANVARWTIEPPKAVGLIEAAGDATVLIAPTRPVITGLNTKTPTMWDPVTAKPLAVLEGHVAPVTVTAWSRDNKFLATGSSDRTVRIWDAAGKPVKTLAGHEGAITCLAWADEKTLASGSIDKTIRIWLTTSDAPPRVLPKQADTVLTLAYTKDGRWLASGGNDRKVQVWQADSDKSTLTIPAAAAVRAVAWAPTGRLLAVSVVNGELHAYAIPGGKLQHSFGREGGTHAISLAWSTDSSTLLVSRSYAAQILRPGSAVPILSLSGLAPVLQSLWGLNGTLFLSCTDRCARVYDQAASALRGTIIVDSDSLAIVSSTGHYRVTDESTSELLYVAQTATTQDTLTAKDFATKYRFRNLPASAALPGGK